LFAVTENTSHTAQYDGSTSDNQPKDSGDLHPSDDQKPTSLGLMYGLSAGHGIKHFGQGALLVMIPSIRATLGLSDVAVGGMSSAQSISSGIANIPAGILTDMFRKKIAWILFASMMMVGVGYFLIAISPVYWALLIGVVIVGFGTSMWHAPAFGTLAARYPERRGFAMAAHLTGAQIGNTASPLIIGFLLAGTIGSWVIFWRNRVEMDCCIYIRSDGCDSFSGYFEIQNCRY